MLKQHLFFDMVRLKKKKKVQSSTKFNETYPLFPLYF